MTFFGIIPTSYARSVMLPKAYSSGDALFAVVTFPAKNLVAMDLIDGNTFTWTWGGTTPNETIIMRIGSAATPAIAVLAFPSSRRVSESVSVTLSDSAFTGAVTYSLTGSVPPGLSISGNQIVGAPTTEGTYNFTVTGTDGSDSDSVALTLSVTAGPTVLVSGMPTSIVLGDSVTGTLTAQNFDSAVTYTLSGNVPPGLSVSGSQIVGTPTTEGSYSFTVTGTDGSFSDSTPVNLTVITAIVSVSAWPASIVLGDSVTGNITTQNFSGTVNYTLSGSVPAGLSISGNQIVGTPTTEGIYSFLLSASDGTHSANTNLNLTVGPFPVISVSAWPASIVLGDSIIATLTTQNFGGAVSYTLSGDVPAGLSISGNQIVGTPTTEGTYSFLLSATDGSHSANTNLNLTVGPFPVISVSAWPASILLGDSVLGTITTVNFAGSVTYTLSGDVPAGLSILGNQITGIPTAEGAYSFLLSAADGSHSANTNLNLTVGPVPVISVSAWPAAILLGESVSGTISALNFGGAVSYTFSGDVPAGLSILGNQITGTPTTEGTYRFTLTGSKGSLSASVGLSLLVGVVKDYKFGANTESYQYYTLNENAALPEPVTYSVIGVLPTGLSIKNGHLKGVTPNQGTYSFSIQMTSGIYQMRLNYIIEVRAPTMQPMFTGVTLNGVFENTVLLVGSTHTTPSETELFTTTVPVHTALTMSFAWDFIKGEYSYLIVGGELPPGLVLNGYTGVITGIPTTAGQYIFVVSVKDWRGRANQWVSLNVE